ASDRLLDAPLWTGAAFPDASEKRRSQFGQLRLQLGRHLLRRGLPDEASQFLLEAIPLTTVVAEAEMLLRKGALLFVEIAVKGRLQHLFALVAGVDREPAHSEAPPSETARSASSRFRMRRPRCRRDITVPTGMSRICAASAYENSPMSTSTSTSRKSWGTSASASTTAFCDNRSSTRSSSGFSSGIVDSRRL